MAKMEKQKQSEEGESEATRVSEGEGGIMGVDEGEDDCERVGESEGGRMRVSEGGAEVDNNNNSDNKHHIDFRERVPGTSSHVKYQLRPRSLHPRRRCDSEWSFQDSLRHKPRPPPLSRYRRKTANARERYRMRQINTAFESLRGVLPSWVCSRRAAAEMTKITTLRLASAYIRSLTDILDGNAPQDTCSWVLSSILGDATPLHDLQPNKSHQTLSYGPPPTDLVTLLCASPEPQVLHDSMDSFSCMSPMSETEAVALLLGTEPQPRSWTDNHHSPLVS